MLLAVAAIAPPAHALEHITLKTGFAYDCASHEPIDATHTRVFLNTASYIDLATDEIVAIDTLPDPPPSSSPGPTAAATHVPTVRELLTTSGAKHNIDVDLLASVVHAESGFNTHAISRTGARGLMQLMPGTAAQLGVQDAFMPAENIRGGTAYLDNLLTRYHDNLALALAAYNAGPAAVDKYHGIPPFAETRTYVARVMREFKRRKAAAALNTHAAAQLR